MEENPTALKSISEDCVDTGDKCRKDLGKNDKVTMHSRGHAFIVRGGGFIDYFSPLYRLVDIIDLLLHREGRLREANWMSTVFRYNLRTVRFQVCKAEVRTGDISKTYVPNGRS